MAGGLVVLAIAGIRFFAGDDGGPSDDRPGLLESCDIGGCRANDDDRPARGYEVPSLAVDPDDPDHIVVADVNLVGGLCGWHVTFDGGESWEDGVFELPDGFKNCQLDSAGFLSAGNVDRGPSGTFYYTFSSARVDDDRRFTEGESVLVTRSTDGGRTFEPAEVAVPGGPVGVSYVRPSLNVVDGGDGEDRVLLSFWECDEQACPRTQFAQSLDGGSTFSAPVLVSQDPGGNGPSVPIIDADGTVHIAFLRRFTDADTELALARSTDGGMSFTNTLVDRRPTIGRAYDAPELAVSPDGRTLYIVFSDNRQGRPDVFFRSSTDGGDTWGQAVLLNSFNGGASYLPQVSVGAEGRVDVVYYQRTGDSIDNVMWTYTSDGGETFSRELQLNDGSINRDIGYAFEVGDSYGPDVASVPGAALVVWSDSRLGNGLTDTQDSALRRVPVRPAPASVGG
jgi:hypothetical protein